MPGMRGMLIVDGRLEQAAWSKMVVDYERDSLLMLAGMMMPGHSGRGDTLRRPRPHRRAQGIKGRISTLWETLVPGHRYPAPN